MQKQRLIYKIKSPYIITSIFNYVLDNNFTMKLFIYSKSFQNKLNLNLIGLKEKYLLKIGFDISKYLYIEQNKYKKDFLTIKYNNFLIENKNDKEGFEKIICDILENKKSKNINEEGYETLINIDSPLFEIISITKNFENNYILYISQKNIDEYKLIDDYKKIFDKLNKSNIKYSSIFFSFHDKKKINYIKEINIDFNKIKSITLIQD